MEKERVNANEVLVRQWTVCQPSVAAYISLMVPNYHDAQDILQEVAVAIFSRDYSSSQMPLSFKAWALAIARNKVIDFRRRGVQVKLPDEILDMMTGVFHELSHEESPRRDALEQCIKRLSAKALHLLELRYRQDQNMAAVAQLSGQSLVAVRVATPRIRTTLRRCIEQRLMPEKA